MKKNVLIVFFWIVTLLGCFYLKSHAQSDKPKFRSFKGTGHIATVKTDLIADETTITYTKTGAKITCENDSVFSILHKTHGMAGGYFALFAGYPEMALNCFLTSAIIITFHKKSQNK
jgi:hypothetical protein